eukprot:g9590.t1
MMKRRQKTRHEVLPDGWEAKQWRKKTVYLNHETKQTQWEKPKIPAPQRGMPIMPDPSSPDAPSNTNAEPTAAPLAGCIAIVDEPTRHREHAVLPGYAAMLDVPSRNREGSPLPEYVATLDEPSRSRKESPLPEYVATLDEPARSRKESSLPGYVAEVGGPARNREEMHLAKQVADAGGLARKREDKPLAGHVVKERRPARKRENTRLAGHVVKERRPARNRDNLPDGWRRATTTEGTTLYINDTDKITSSDRPVTIPSPAVPPQSGSQVEKRGKSSTASTATVSHSAPHYDYNRRSTIDKKEPRKSRPRENITHRQRMGKPSPSGGPRSTSTSTSNTRQEGDEEPGSPLPHGWIKEYTKRGRPFYHNNYDQTITWEKPRLAATGRTGARTSTSTSSDSDIRPFEAYGRDAHLAPESPESPLPAGWSEQFTEDGERYYLHEHDKTTIWERPTKAPTPRVASKGKRTEREKSKSPPATNSSEEQRGQPLPPGWSQAVTPDGEIYYENHIDQTTSWKPPVVTPAYIRDEAARPETSRRRNTSGARDRPQRTRPDGHTRRQKHRQHQPAHLPQVAAPASHFENYNDQTPSWDPPAYTSDDEARPEAFRNHGTNDERDGSLPTRPDVRERNEHHQQHQQPPEAAPAPSYGNHDQTPSWDPRTHASDDAGRPQEFRHQRTGGATDIPLPTSPEMHAQEQHYRQQQHHPLQQPRMAAPASVEFDSTVSGVPPGTQPTPQIQQVGMKQKAVMQAAFGKGMDMLKANMKAPTATSPPKEQQPEKGPSSLRDQASNYLLKKVTGGINDGMDAIGVGNFVKVQIKKDKKNGGLKWSAKPRLKIPKKITFGAGSDPGEGEVVEEQDEDGEEEGDEEEGDEED